MKKFLLPHILMNCAEANIIQYFGILYNFQGGTDTEKRAPGSIFLFHQLLLD